MVCYRKPDKRQTMKRGFATKRDAQLFAATVEVSKAKGEYVAPKLGRVSVGELAPNWLARKQRATAPSHYRMLDSAWRVHVQPHWCTVPVADVDLLAVEEWITGMVDKGAGATTVLRAYGVLSGILADAVKGKRLAVNPAKGVENLPRKTARRHVYLSSDDVHRLADAAGQHRALVLVLAYCGVRWGEAVALTGARRRVPAASAVGVGERRAARRGSRRWVRPRAARHARCRCPVRARRAVGAVPGQRHPTIWCSGAGRQVPAPPEVAQRMVLVGGEAGQGAEDHAARSAAHMRVAVSVGRGQRVWRCNACSGTRRRR